METSRDPRGVPSGDGAGGRTPHTKFQLMEVRPEPIGGTYWLELNGEQRRCYVTHPKTAHPYAVVHTRADRDGAQKWEGKARYKRVIMQRLTPWYASDDAKAFLAYAEEGAYDEQAEAAGYDSPFSYVLEQIHRRNAEVSQS